jgi:hypothetical protein
MNNLRNTAKTFFTAFFILALLTLYICLTGCVNTPDQVVHVKVMVQKPNGAEAGNQKHLFNIVVDGNLVVEDQPIEDTTPFITKVTLKPGLHRLKIVEKDSGAVVQAAIDSSPEQWFLAEFLVNENGEGTIEYNIQKKPWDECEEEKPSETSGTEQSLSDSEKDEKNQKISDKFDNLKDDAKNVKPWGKKSTGLN